MKNNMGDNEQYFTTPVSQSTTHKDEGQSLPSSYLPVLFRLGEAKPLSSSSELETLERLSAACATLWHQDAATRASVICSLGNIWGKVQEESEKERLVQLIKKSLYDYYWEVRVASAKVLAIVGGRIAVEALIPVLQGDSNEHVRAMAARSLGELGELAPIRPLIMALAAPQWRIRAAAVEALGKLKEQSVADRLLSMANDDPDISVRIEAIHAVSTLRGKAATKDLLQIAQKDEEWLIQEAIVTALTHLGEHAHAKILKEVLDSQFDATESWDEAYLSSSLQEGSFCHQTIGSSLGQHIATQGQEAQKKDSSNKRHPTWKKIIPVPRGISCISHRAAQGSQGALTHIYTHWCKKVFSRKNFGKCRGTLVFFAALLALTFVAGTLVPTFASRPRFPDSATWVPSVPLSSVGPQQHFIIHVTLTNNGSTTWSGKDGYKLTQCLCDTRGQQNIHCIHSSDISLGDTSVQPGQQITFTIHLTSPLEPGEYYLWWTLRDDHTSFISGFLPIEVGNSSH